MQSKVENFLFKLVTAIIIAVIPYTGSLADEAVKHPKKELWVFDGMFGRFDRASIQRGLQVYTEVCAACHSIKRIRFNDLKKIGFSAAEVKALAANYKVTDGPNDFGEMFQRNAIPSDSFPGPYANDAAAKAANNGSNPPDLSLMIKARHDGANYVYSLLTGYQDAPKDFSVPVGLYYNPYFPGQKIAMPAPLISEGQVTYQDGTKSTTSQMAWDLVNFLQWSAEPEMEERKSMGLKVLLFLFFVSIVFYFTMKNFGKMWNNPCFQLQVAN